MALNLTDCWLTESLVANGLRELNPVWQVIPVWYKAAVALCLIPFLVGRPRITVIVNIGLTLVVAWNLFVYLY